MPEGRKRAGQPAVQVAPAAAAAVVFDMDGVLLDSEPLWQETEVEVFATVGVPLTLKMCEQTMGLRYDEVVRYWYRRFPWQGPTVEQVAETLLEAMVPQLRARAAAMCLPGVHESLALIRDQGLPIALATSSPRQLIEVTLDALKIRTYFHSSHSAEDQRYGKPHPGVYLAAAEALGASPAHCLAIEDSVNGVISAKAAQMRCIAIPGVQGFDEPRFAIADLRLRSLEALTTEHLKLA